ncbi:hypothetical protein CW304_16785 [Bacillus sp. UFRGS-B20]|nr:hypothetical protein CW304_16785 [Bacillus sp. UFRGS-B20]
MIDFENPNILVFCGYAISKISSSSENRTWQTLTQTCDGNLFMLFHPNLHLRPSRFLNATQKSSIIVFYIFSLNHATVRLSLMRKEIVGYHVFRP